MTNKRLDLTVLDPATAGPGHAPDSSTDASTPAGANLRREVLDLPLVRDALETFPDATLIDARTEDETPPQP